MLKTISLAVAIILAIQVTVFFSSPEFYHSSTWLIVSLPVGYVSGLIALVVAKKQDWYPDE